MTCDGQNASLRNRQVRRHLGSGGDAEASHWETNRRDERSAWEEPWPEEDKKVKSCRSAKKAARDTVGLVDVLVRQLLCMSGKKKRSSGSWVLYPSLRFPGP